jgi:hypothetical protein
VDAAALCTHFDQRRGAVISVPVDPHLAENAEVGFGQLRAPAQDAFLLLAAIVRDGFGRLRNQAQPPSRLHEPESSERSRRGRRPGWSPPTKERRNRRLRSLPGPRRNRRCVSIRGVRLSRSADPGTQLLSQSFGARG